MTGITKDLADWERILGDWDKLMLKNCPGTDMDYGSAVVLYLTGLADGNLFELLQPSLTPEVLPAAQKMKQKGFDLLVKLNAVVPPPEMKLPHEQITACVQRKVDMMGQLEAAITRSKSVKLSEETDPCNLMPESIKKVNDFIHANQ